MTQQLRSQWSGICDHHRPECAKSSDFIKTVLTNHLVALRRLDANSYRAVRTWHSNRLYVEGWTPKSIAESCFFIHAELRFWYIRRTAAGNFHAVSRVFDLGVTVNTVYWHLIQI